MRRREFITFLSGAAPFAVSAQQPERMPRIGALMAAAADDPEIKPHRGVPAGPAATGLGVDGLHVWIETRLLPPIPTTFAGTRPNWPRLRRTSSWLVLAPATGAVNCPPTFTGEIFICLG